MLHSDDVSHDIVEGVRGSFVRVVEFLESVYGQESEVLYSKILWLLLHGNSVLEEEPDEVDAVMNERLHHGVAEGLRRPHLQSLSQADYKDCPGGVHPMSRDVSV